MSYSLAVSSAYLVKVNKSMRELIENNAKAGFVTITYKAKDKPRKTMPTIIGAVTTRKASISPRVIGAILDRYEGNGYDINEFDLVRVAVRVKGNRYDLRNFYAPNIQAVTFNKTGESFVQLNGEVFQVIEH